MPSFSPSPSPSVGSFTAATWPASTALTPVTTSTRRIRYGDHPKLNGSVTYGEIIAEAGFTPPAATPSVGAFTPKV